MENYSHDDITELMCQRLFVTKWKLLPKLYGNFNLLSLLGFKVHTRAGTRAGSD